MLHKLIYGSLLAISIAGFISYFTNNNIPPIHISALSSISLVISNKLLMRACDIGDDKTQVSITVTIAAVIMWTCLVVFAVR